ncbi:phosphatase PAP2 family protein [Aneurinibacillus terranovensis]|uniref:phosphatase PAP2 family protein n=1 Tax=Aneurinibacillus terranovensis TaxID=278991 RepID=UPI0003FD3EF6|nr:phosphatase PAP2 family protein [Aneurinibacillus terranovensis]
MNRKRQFEQALFLLVCLAAGFGFLAVLVSEKKTGSFDTVITALIQGFEAPAITSVMKFFTFIGSGSVVTVLTIMLSLFFSLVLKHRSELILFLVVVLGTYVFNEVLKHIFHRARPYLHRLIEVTGYSFPSGHSMESFAFYGVLTFLLWRHVSTRAGRTILILFSSLMILAIGISRIYLGVHYPSDVIGGYLAGGLWLTAAIWFYRRVRR